MTNQVNDHNIEFVVDNKLPTIIQEHQNVQRQGSAIILLQSGEHDCRELQVESLASEEDEKCCSVVVEDNNQFITDDFIVFDQQTISDNGDPLDIVVPSDYAAETVVMTTDCGTCHTENDADDKQSYSDNFLESSSSSHVKELLRQLGKRSTEAKHNAQYDSTWAESIEAKNEIMKNCVSSLEQQISLENEVQEDDSVELTPKEITKRERDRTKKREQRRNPLHRQKEQELSRHRMKSKRKDPEYREKERQRDRERRRLARQTNEELRKKERERDKQKKKSVRGSTKELRFLKEHETLVNTSEPVSMDNCLSMIDSGRQTYWGGRHLVLSHDSSVLSHDSSVLSHDSSVIQSASHVFEEDVDEDCDALLPSHLDFDDKSTIDPDTG